MKTALLLRVFPALFVITAAAIAESEPRKDIVIRRQHADADREGPGPRMKMRLHKDGPGMEKEKVAFLGVETAPVSRTVAAQLGLPRDIGLVVRRVADGSPASSVIQEHDILTKLDDQILIDTRQLGVLVRSRKTGEEVKLTLMRGGKETTVKARLAEQEVPKLAGLPGEFGEGGENLIFRRAFPGGGLPGPGAEPGDVMRLIGRDRMHWFAAPRVHVFKRGQGKGATVLDLPAGNFVFSDEQGSVEVNASDGKRELTVKNPKGDVTFQGPLNTPEDHDKLPPEVVARLDSIGGAELGDDDDALEFETNVLPPPTKTRRALPEKAPEPGMRSL